MDDLEKYLDPLIEFATIYGMKILGAIVVLIVGLRVIKIMVSAFTKIMEKRNTDPSLRGFFISLIRNVLKVLLVITVMSMLSIEMTSFIAIIGAAGLAIGMALSGSLQNFAGGVMILSFKPYKVGDFIDAQGHSGTVKAIQLFNTVLKTPDNKTILIPNGPLSTGSMTNYSTEPRRRVDWTIGIGYGDDVDKAKTVIKRLADADDRILKDPEVFIAVSELADSSVNFAVRGWVEAADYWPVFFDMNENVYKTFAEEGLNIPFPQMDVHVHKD